MQQRLGLARALVHDPKILILDEPTTGLDPRARVEMREILRELSKMGRTSLLASHILPELSSVCNRIGIIARGNLVAVGSLDEVAASVAAPRITFSIGPIEGDPEVSLTEALGRPVAWDQAREAWWVDAGGDTPLTPESVAGRIVGHGLPLRYLAPVKASLEEVFLRLTEDLELGSEEKVPL
jgi:ABC-2 type transport system ATP-binding protein